MNKETLKNAFQLFEEEGIVTLAKNKEAKKGKANIKLAADWTPNRDPATEDIVPQGKLWDFIETIALSRREGKNRRDGATVSTRVLALADMIGRELFASAAASESGSEGVAPKKRKRRKEIGLRARL